MVKGHNLLMAPFYRLLDTYVRQNACHIFAFSPPQSSYSTHNGLTDRLPPPTPTASHSTPISLHSLVSPSILPAIIRSTSQGDCLSNLKQVWAFTSNTLASLSPQRTLFSYRDLGRSHKTGPVSTTIVWYQELSA